MNRQLTIYIDTPENGSISYSSGFASKLSGSSIPYHCSHPEAEKALLVRTNQAMQAICWISDPPRICADGFIYLCWIGGIAGCQGGPHCFELYAQNTAILKIYSTTRDQLPATLYTGKDGIELRYEHQLTDMCADHFGMFWLRLPGVFFASEGIKLELRAENTDSQDWMMVFEYPFGQFPKLRFDPVLACSGEQLMRKGRILIDSLSLAGSVKITDEQEVLIENSLQYGLNKFELDIRYDNEITYLTVESYFNDLLLDIKLLPLQPINPVEVYILPYSHNDIGYTEIQTVVTQLQGENIDRALDLIDLSRDYPPEAITKWNLEVIWALEHWWEKASDQDKERFVQAVQAGFIGLNALYANPLTGLCNLVEIQHHFDLAHWVSSWTGSKIETATVTDIPGFVWSLLPALAMNGVKYFSIAPNAGDRTGFIYEGLGDKPFYWASPSGKEQVLTWVKGASYSQFHKEKITGNGIRKLMNYLVELQNNNYPYDIVALPYTIGGDNGGPDEALSDFVRAWNEKYHSPRLIIATHQQLFTAFETRYGDSLPILKGDMTPYWEDGAMSTAKETLQTRKAADRLIQAECLSAMLDPHHFEQKKFYHAWQQIILWDEHTWGAWNSVSDPDLDFVKQQWEIKQQFAMKSEQLSEKCLKPFVIDAADINIQKLPDTLKLVNTISWGRTAIIHLRNQLTQNRIICDHNGLPLPYQLTSSGKLIQVTFERGWQILSLRLGEVEYHLQTDEPETDKYTMENTHFRLSLDRNSGNITELYHKRRGANLLMQDKALGQLFYITEGQVHQPLTNSSFTHLFTRKGIFYDELQISYSFPGCHGISLELKLHHQQELIELCLRIDKKAIRSRESLHWAFPFALPHAILRYDSAGAPVIPGKNQLPGMCRNFFSPTSYVDISGSGAGITIALTDLPLVELGGFTAELPWMKNIEPGIEFFGYLMNNIWHTNYKADQEGKVAFRCALGFHQDFVPQDALRFALEQRQPAMILNNDIDNNHSLLPIYPPDYPFTVLSVKPGKKIGEWLLLIINPSELTAVCAINFTGKTGRIWMSNPQGEKLHELKGLEFAGYEQRFIVVEAN